MHLLRISILVLYACGAVVLVTGHAYDDVKVVLSSDPVIIHAFEDEPDPVRAIPPKQQELLSSQSPAIKETTPDEVDETYVRPAWVMFAGTVFICAYSWICHMYQFGIFSF